MNMSTMMMIQYKIVDKLFLDCGQQLSGDDIPSCVEIPFDRVGPLKLVLHQIASKRFDSTALKY